MNTMNVVIQRTPNITGEVIQMLTQYVGGVSMETMAGKIWEKYGAEFSESEGDAFRRQLAVFREVVERCVDQQMAETAPDQALLQFYFRSYASEPAGESINLAQSMVLTFLNIGIHDFDAQFRYVAKAFRQRGQSYIPQELCSGGMGIEDLESYLSKPLVQQLQELNAKKDTASDAMIMFLCINASGLTLIPITIMMYRAQLGAANPSDVFLPIMLATFTSTLVAILAVCFKQRINILQRNLLLFFGGAILFIGGVFYLFHLMSQEQVSLYSTLFANTLLFTIICGFIVSGMRKKINVYDAFIEGAKEGFHTAITIIPYLVAILVAVGIFRASGAMDFLIDGVRWTVASLGMNTDFVEALPTILMKPLSGSGARGMMLDAMNTYGADSFVGRLSSIAQGACDTTFYVVALYYGSVGIKNTRYTVPCALLADLAGAIAAIIIAYLFFS